MLALLEQAQDAAGILLLGFCGILGNDLEVDAVLAHEGDGQAGEGTAKQDEEHGDDEEDPELAALLLVAIVQLVQHANGCSGGDAEGEDGPGEPEDGWAERHQRVGSGLLPHCCGLWERRLMTRCGTCGCVNCFAPSCRLSMSVSVSDVRHDISSIGIATRVALAVPVSLDRVGGVVGGASRMYCGRN